LSLTPRHFPPPGIAVLVDHFPQLTETFVSAEARALRDLGHAVRVEARERPPAPDPAAAAGLTVAYAADDGRGRRLGDLLWLAARHPRACVADLRARRRRRREEWVAPLARLAPVARRIHRSGARHVHAHFAAGAALDAMRIAALLGLPYSVTAHAFDIWLVPRNLPEKLSRAAFATTGCEYNARHLRELAPGARIEVVVMGVDGERFRRSRPLPGGRTVAAVGRLVPKKGFADLVRAARGVADSLVVVGDGPLRAELAALAAREGVPADFRGELPPDAVRAVLEDADVLAMPCVVAPDGDRDSMPVVVKEALAMELCVVASDEVGLPEVVREPWGVLHAPGDTTALAAALRAVLDRPPPERARAGAAGRAWVLEHASLRHETARLSELISSVR
jgi:colanic acid/amylovoran biosynthesis glycosyltransferase